MHADPAPSVSPEQPRRSTRQRPRSERLAAVIDLEARRLAHTGTLISVGEAHHVAPSTLRGWQQRAHPDDPDPTVRFFESPAGLVLLHRLLLAALLVIVLMGGNGVALVRLFFHLTGLDRFTACSESHLHGLVRRLQAKLACWEQSERTRLAAGMAPRSIAVAADETFFPDGMLLVAQEPVSNFLLLEAHAARRDALTWASALRVGLSGLPVTLESLTADQAGGLVRAAEEVLGIPHHSDLMHGQHELAKAIFGPLRAVQREAHAAHQKAQEAFQGALAGRAEALRAQEQGERRAGRPVNWPARVQRAVVALGEAEQRMHQVAEHRAALKQGLQELGESVSPIDVRTGRWVRPEQVRERLESLLQRMREHLVALRLGHAAWKRAWKAKDWVAAWVGQVAWFQAQVQAAVSAAGLMPEVERLVVGVLIPALLLDQARRRAPTALLRRALGEVLAARLVPLYLSGSVWSTLPTEEKQKLVRLAMECAGKYQRSSSCVEGRNGYLSLRHHHLHALPANWLSMLTVLHNYVVTREDGTTAAERFFGQKPGDLFEHLVQVMPLPARPRNRACKPKPDLFALAV